MTIYPVQRHYRALVWFAGSIAVAALLILGWFWLAVHPAAREWWLMATGLASMGLLTGVIGFFAYRVGWIQRLPRIGSTVLAGYALAAVVVCLTVGWIVGLFFVDAYDRLLIIMVMFFAMVLMLALGYLHATAISARVEALTGAADALRLGRFQARVELDGEDQLAQLAHTFNAMADKVEAVDRKERQLNAVRSDLLGWIGGDLRVPLSSTRGIVEALAEGVVDNPETYLRYLRTARRNINILSDLLDDLVDLAQLDTEGIVLDRHPAQIDRLIADTVETLAPSAAEKGVLLSGAAAPGVQSVSIDARQIGRVLNNLATQALRRTPQGGLVKINAYPTREGVLFEVVDYFEGERPEDMTQLLELFLAEDDVRRRGSKVAPLGMAMASAIVEAHGGRIRAERNGGKGLRLVFILSEGETVASQIARGM